ncbi:MAG: histidine triad nucleotide-binding protein [Candidatus Nealsonbacteria bacterium]
MDCLFCKIIKKELPSEIVYEDDKVLAFKDINPRAPVHFLIVPKKHIPSVDHVEFQDKELMGDLILAAQKIAKEKKLRGYRLQINVGRSAGQIVDHLHLHLLSRAAGER